MTGTLAQTIQGESDGSAASMFAVASTIYNRGQAGTFPGGTNYNAIVNAPSQYVGYSANPSASAQQFADAVENGTLSNYGTVGNAVNFQTAGSNTTLGSNPNAVTIGGNNFSDNFGSPTSNFVAPSYGGTSLGSASAGNGGIVYSWNDPTNTSGGSAGGVGGYPIDYTGTTSAEPYYDPLNFPAADVGTVSATGVAGGTGQSETLNFGQQLTQSFNNWVNGATNALTGTAKGAAAAMGLDFENWFVRGGMLLLGLVLLFIALRAVTEGTGAGEATARTLRGGARGAGNAVGRGAASLLASAE